MKRLIVVCLCLGFVSLLNAKSSIDKLAADISNQTVSMLKTNGQVKIFFADFTDLNGKIVFFGKYLSGKIGAEVVKQKNVMVLERSGLDRIMEEQKLSVSGMINNPEQAQKIGQLYGAEYIVIGTLTDLGKTLDVTAKIIQVSTGKVIGSPNSTMPMTKEVLRLITKIIDTEQMKEDELKQKQAALEAEINLKAREMTAEIEAKKKAMVSALEAEQREKEQQLLKIDADIREKSKTLKLYDIKEKELQALADKQRSKELAFKQMIEILGDKAKNSVTCGMTAQDVLEALGKPRAISNVTQNGKISGANYGTTWVFFLDTMVYGTGQGIDIYNAFRNRTSCQ